MEKNWNGLPYRSISEFYQTKFGEKIYKIPVGVVDTCPNRMGLKGMKTCSFCDVWGSAAKSEHLVDSLEVQIEKYHALLVKKYNVKKFLVYFQAYTNTFTKISALRANFETAFQFPYVNGFVVGTRPDCISPAVLNLWQEMHERSFVSVELGVQSFNEDHLVFMRRGHTAKQSIAAIETIAKQTNVDLGLHFIFGNPGETEKDILESARMCNELPISNVKLHNLHVLTNTHLETLYKQGEFDPISFESYAEKVQLFIEHLSPRIYVHRLAAYAPRWDELVAPAWTSDKMKTHQGIITYLRERGSYQSRQFLCETNESLELKQRLYLQSSKRVADIELHI